MWQELIVALCVLIALAFWIKKLLLRKKSTSAACGSCSGCGTNKHCSK
jgi:hypothetical protein